jgi:hypothetical protein
MDVLRQTPATGCVEEPGDLIAPLGVLTQTCVHGGVQLLEADLTAMKSVQ